MLVNRFSVGFWKDLHTVFQMCLTPVWHLYREDSGGKRGKIGENDLIFCRLTASETENKNPRNPHKYLGFGDFVLEAPPRIELGNEGFADFHLITELRDLMRAESDSFSIWHQFDTNKNFYLSAQDGWRIKVCIDGRVGCWFPARPHKPGYEGSIPSSASTRFQKLFVGCTDRRLWGVT